MNLTTSIINQLELSSTLKTSFFKSSTLHSSLQLSELSMNCNPSEATNKRIVTLVHHVCAGCHAQRKVKGRLISSSGCACWQLELATCQQPVSFNNWHTTDLPVYLSLSVRWDSPRVCVRTACSKVPRYDKYTVQLKLVSHALKCINQSNQIKSYYS